MKTDLISIKQELIRLASSGAPRPDGRTRLGRALNLLTGTKADHSYRRAGYATAERHGSATHPEAVLRGEDRYGHKLTANDVRKIRSMHRIVTQQRIADHFGVCRSVIQRILNGKSWKHVD
jgi:hypothetical protein